MSNKKTLLEKACSYITIPKLKKRVKPKLSDQIYETVIAIDTTREKALKRAMSRIATDTKFRHFSSRPVLDFYMQETIPETNNMVEVEIHVLPVRAWDTLCERQKRYMANEIIKMFLISETNYTRYQLKKITREQPYNIVSMKKTEEITPELSYDLSTIDLLLISHHDKLGSQEMVKNLLEKRKLPTVVLAEQISPIHTCTYQNLGVNYIINIESMSYLDKDLLFQTFDDAVSGKQGLWNYDFIRP